MKMIDATTENSAFHREVLSTRITIRADDRGRMDFTSLIF